MEQSTWLNSLKAGDTYIILNHYAFSRLPNKIKITVEKITNQQIHLSNGNKYWKKDGRMIGKAYKKIPVPATEEELDEFHQAFLKEKLSNTLKTVNWNALPLSSLENILSTVEIEQNNAGLTDSLKTPSSAKIKP